MQEPQFTPDEKGPWELNKLPAPVPANNKATLAKA